MLKVLRHPVFGRLFLAHVMALFGTGLATLALGFVAFDLAGERAGSITGTVLALKMLCFLVVSPVAVALLVRVPTRVVLTGSEVLRAGVAVALPFVSEVWAIYVLIVVMHVASAVFTPTFQATLPAVLGDEAEYGRALSLSRMAYDVEALVSPILVGLLLLVLPAQNLFFGTAVGFAASAALIAPLMLPRSAGQGSEVRSLPDRMGRGVRLLFATPALRGIFCLHLAVAGGGGFALVQTVALVKGPLGLGDAGVAVAMGAMGAGSIGAALASVRSTGRYSTRRVLLAGGILLSAAPLGVPAVLALGGAGGLVLLGGLWFFLGAGYASVLTPIGLVVRASVPEEELPAVFAAQFSLAHAWWLVCFPLAGWLGSYASLGATAVLMGLVSLGATAAARWIWARPAALVPAAQPDTTR